MSIMKKAQELGESIVESTEYSELKTAEETMQADESAQAILQEFQAKQRMLQMMQMNGQEVNDETRNELEALQAKMQENENIKNFMDAQNKFNKVMQTVNQVITSALSGEEEDCASGNCGGGCC
ncbi:YlbF family regulator [Orenia marismortui]|uniref:Cell fate (Sporulation/competence/biofilm development) regulator YlbF (YheA/YmcA/DUF963 family) n=1 Tax=Orenia marismortui TaxID=46469 RepID=A0A4R8GLQ9_9FIRM|nr:YlbF family regulator [Orenia marismortui]TDX46600.1 cell fate (sporulation/competence/biofilm development) regulator YlbF (YheA/YmcA/DUF963 family) [Orenia marismortui]